MIDVLKPLYIAKKSRAAKQGLNIGARAATLTLSEVTMQTAKINCYCIVFVLIFGLILAPIAPHTVLAAEQGAAAAGSTSDQTQTGKATGTATGAAGGVGVSGSSDKAAPSGKGALAPPPKKSPPSQPTPLKSTDEQKSPKAIGASAGKVGTTGADSETGGISMGWKITAGVLGVGLLLGLAGGGGGGGGSGGGSTTATDTH
jgi:hypothetical protein